MAIFNLFVFYLSMKVQNFNPVNFQKRLVATCKIGSADNSCDAKIYLLDKKDDYYELKEAKNSENWEGNYYLNNIQENFCLDFKKINHHIMENPNGDIICVTKSAKKGKKTSLEYIETAPKLSCYNHIRALKYIGETMLAFLAKDAKESRKILVVPTVAERPKTLNFYYNQCGFDKNGLTNAIMPREKVDRFLKNNEKHTGGPINLL